MNKVILMGRLTREPDIRYSQGERQMAIARFTLAVDRRMRSANNGESSADFISCVAFDRLAEFAEKYLHQGTKVVLSGRIQTGSYTKNDGTRVYTTDVIADDIEFAESKAASANSNGGAAYNNSGRYQSGYSNNNSRPANSGYQQVARPEPGSAVSDGFMNIPDGVEDDDLPFN